MHHSVTRAALAAALALTALALPALASDQEGAPGEELYIIYQDGKQGFMNREGKLVIPARFDLASLFHEGLARVYTTGSNNKAGFIDPTGKWAIEPRFGSAKDFSHGRAVARDPKTGNWGYIDRTGEWAIPPLYERAQGFRDGRALVEIGRRRGAVLDVDGKVVFTLPPEADIGDPPKFSDGLMGIELKGAKRSVRYVDRDGKTAFEGPWKFGRAFSEGLAAVRDADGWSFVDPTGKVVLSGFDFAWSFRDGLAIVTMKGEERSVFIDRTGKVALRPTVEGRLGSFREGLAEITQGKKIGFIDRTGAWVIEPTWDDPQGRSFFRGGLATVGKRTPDGKLLRGFIDKTGKVVWPPSR